MKNKRKTIFLLVTLFLIVLAVYFMLAFYYREGFSFNTWINGVYCTGKTVEEVNSELLSGIEAPIVVITDKEGQNYYLPMEDVGYQVDYKSALQNYQEEQNPFLWIDNITFHSNHSLEPSAVFDTERLSVLFQELDFVTEEKRRATDFFLYKGENGFELYNGLTDRIDLEKTYELLLEALSEGVYEIDLQQAGCYYDLPLTDKQEKQAVLWPLIQAFQACDIIYDMGAEQLEMSPSVMAGLLETAGGLPVMDASGELVLSADGIAAFVRDLADTYDTYGKERIFEATRGETVTIAGKGTYGTKINQKKEIEYLTSVLPEPEAHDKIPTVHIPEYSMKAFARGVNDIGDTYVEVDMTEQKLYCYVSGELKLETDIVTGNMRRNMDTPEGVNYVYAKQKNRILRGQGYASPVKFWMPVKGGIGLHDANWRSEFGGEIYKTNGSHGCINIPPEVMPELYEMVEIGTPVVMFY